MKIKSVFASTVILLLVITTWNTLNAQDNRNTNFRLSFGANYLSRFTAYGIDLAEESAAYGLSTSLLHTSGLYADAYFTNPTSTTVDAQQISFDIGYEKEFSSIFSLSAEFSQYFFSSDTANILSQFSNAFSINADLSLDLFDIGLSYDRFLGESGASYFSIDISTFHEVGPLYILPMYQAVFTSQTVDESILLKTKGKKKDSQSTATSTELSGLANSIITVVAIYPVFKNLSVSFTPSLILSHNDELSSEASQFVWNVGLRYRFYL
ncbi:MAG: hypothetical protein KAS18_06085 [Calditrichia bacterium]|nr:hypothetical protein [Calditrichia bacterium]